MSGHLELAAPSPWVVRWTGLLPARAAVLDVACGRGRHARFLAGRGHAVEAVDRDPAALAALAGVEGVVTRQADLEGGPWPYAGRAFDAVVVTSYLHRPLFPALEEAVAEGGLLVYETFMRGNEALGRPVRPEFLLAAGELLGAFPRLAVIAFEQGRVTAPWPAAVQRLCAVKGLAPAEIPIPPLPLDPG